MPACGSRSASALSPGPPPEVVRNCVGLVLGDRFVLLFKHRICSSDFNASSKHTHFGNNTKGDSWREQISTLDARSSGEVNGMPTQDLQLT
ncbi:hypothetical protein BGAL_0370g00090 [Botrytis galanthina]|uniref:Uncharacterized protein n=1 Tax=Botrytis galanthina TaxID=278940 RepID=A0A4V4HTS3_9HELO|nr:hypothetical protein BGAL_0370g00090 [Botrytis galanthina]